MICRHCFEDRVELYDCPQKGTTPKATCGCAEPICRTCAREQGVEVRPNVSRWQRAADDFEKSGY